MRHPARSALRRYGIAVAAVVGAVLATLLLPPLQEVPYVLFFAAVLLSGWWGGVGPSLAAIALSILAVEYLFEPPYGSLDLGFGPWIRSAGFAGVATLITWFAVARRRAEDRLALELADMRQAEWALRESEKRFRHVVESAPFGMLIIDGTGTIRLVNPQTEAMFGYGRDELIGWPVEVLLPDRFRGGHPGRRESFLAEPRARRMGAGRDLYGLRKDGSEFPVEIGLNPIETPEGVQVLSAIVNITERKQIEAQLARQTAMLREQAVLLDRTHALTFDLDGRIIYWSHGVAELYGYSAAEAVGQMRHELLRTEFPQPRHEIEAKVLGAGQWQGELHHIRRDGQRVIVASHWTLSRDPEGEHPVILEVNNDITELDRARAALRDTDRRKDEFLATLAHELRSPLAPIRYAVEALKLKGPPEPSLQWASEVIHRQVAQLSRLIHDLVDVARITRDRLELRKERVDLEEVLYAGVEISRPLIEARGQAFVVSMPSDPIHLDGDPARLAQVIANLLENATKFTERGGRIWLTAERQGSDAVVTVRDTGIGIPGEVLPRIFDMATRLAPSPHGGLGIGLTLVRRLVEMHGGTITARSDGPGKGSEFSVRLPVAIETSPAPTLPVRPGPRAAPASPLRILVVDDDPDTAAALAKLLEMMGHDIRTAHDGLEAVERADEFRPDVVLLDVGLPRMNGHEAARRIRQQPWGKGMVLIATTGWAQEVDKQSAKDAGFDHHLVKPVDPVALMSLLASLKGGAAQ